MHDVQTIDFLGVTMMKNDTVFCPIKGRVIPLNQVPDEAFAQNMMGEGIAIIPTEGKVFAPFDGHTDILPDTKHALGLCSDSGIELLIHIGLETVELAGKFYTLHTAEEKSFKKGDLLLEFDIHGIEEAGYKIITPVTLTNGDEFAGLEYLAEFSPVAKIINVGGPLFSSKRKITE